MKKALFVALALVSSAFCGYTGNLTPTQVSIVQGCGTSANSTGVAVQLPGYSPLFLITSTNPLYTTAYTLAIQAIASGKHVNVEFPTNSTTMSYMYNGTCIAPVGFNVLEGINIAP
jgi:hypothetical protein